MYVEENEQRQQTIEYKKKRLMQLLYLNRIAFLKPIEKYIIVKTYMDYRYPDVSDRFFHKVLKFSYTDWRQFVGRNIREKSCEALRYEKIKEGVISDMRWLHSQHGGICTIDDESYPHLLREIDDPPIVLYYIGDLSNISRPSVSIVGTRKPNQLGDKASFDMGKALCKKGINVVSGFALGIDIAAHKGLLSSYQNNVGHNGAANINTNINTNINQCGNAVVVLGTHIDYIYPRRHLPFAQKILNVGGVFLSELPLHMNMNKYSFISRNRIISGLSMDTVVVQSPSKSGALATARFALEQGRELWVHSVGMHPDFQGSQKLVEEGAGVLNSADDMELPIFE